MATEASPKTAKIARYVSGLSRNAPWRYRRRVSRPRDRRPLSLDGRPRVARYPPVDRRAEPRDRTVSPDAAAAGALPRSHHCLVGLPEGVGTGGRGRPALLPAERRPAEAGGHLSPRTGSRAGPRPRSQHALARRRDRADGLCPLAGCPAARLHPRSGWRRLADRARRRYPGPARPRRSRPLDAILRARLDARQPGLLLLTVSRAAARQGPGGCARQPRALLPPPRHAAGRGPSDLRAARSAVVVHQRHGERRRSIPAHWAVRGGDEQQPAVLCGPGRSGTPGRDVPGAAGGGAGWRRVRADRDVRHDAVRPIGPRGAESVCARVRPRSRRRRPSRRRSGASGNTRRRSPDWRAAGRGIPRRRAEPDRNTRSLDRRPLRRRSRSRGPALSAPSMDAPALRRHGWHSRRRCSRSPSMRRTWRAAC